ASGPVYPRTLRLTKIRWLRPATRRGVQASIVHKSLIKRMNVPKSVSRRGRGEEHLRRALEDASDRLGRTAGAGRPATREQVVDGGVPQTGLLGKGTLGECQQREISPQGRSIPHLHATRRRQGDSSREPKNHRAYPICLM